jgi:hypothetical protein
MACDRTGCEGIMCDRHSSDYGYICNDCFNELVGLGHSVNIEEFMGNVKTDINVNYAHSLEKWNNIFKP